MSGKVPAQNPKKTTALGSSSRRRTWGTWCRLLHLL